MERTLARTEPHLGLAERLGAVVDEQRQVGAGPQQPAERHGVPVDGLAVHHDAEPVLGRRALLDDAGHPHADAEHGLRVGAGTGQYLGESGEDQLDHVVDVVALVGQWVVAGGEFGQGQVEQGDPDLGLTDVDADQVGPPRGHLEQDPRPSAVRLHRAALLDQPVGEQFAGHVADRAGAQAGDPPQLLAAERPVEVQPAQQRGSAAPPQVTYGLLASKRHGLSLLG